MVFFIALFSIVTLEQPHIKNFLIEASKSGKNEYAFVKAINCKSGKLKNTYAITQNGKVILKQLSSDGTVGPVCIN